MAQARILLADNDQDFLETRREFLEREGYEIVTATSPAETREKLEQEELDLVILDVRLLNDDDEKDISGLELAKSVRHSLPIVILTGYPAMEYVLQALRPQIDGIPVAQDFAIKQDGPKALLTAVRRVLEIAEDDATTLVAATEGKVEKIPVFKRWRLTIALVTLLLALGSGIMATIYSNPQWLIGTVFLVILTTFFIGIRE